MFASRDVLLDTLLKLPLADLKSYCQSNSEINTICNDDRFWEIKFKRDYDINDRKNVETNRERYGSWRKLYEVYKTSEKLPIDIYISGQYTASLNYLYSRNITTIVNMIRSSNKIDDKYLMIFTDINDEILFLVYDLDRLDNYRRVPDKILTFGTNYVNYIRTVYIIEPPYDIYHLIEIYENYYGRKNVQDRKLNNIKNRLQQYLNR